MKGRKLSSGSASPRKRATNTRVRSQSDIVADQVSHSTAFLRATAEAESCANDPERLRKLLDAALAKLNYVPRGPFAETWPYLMAMIRVIRAHHSGEYRDIPSEHLLTIVAAMMYFVSPNDAIPDAVPILGQLDDALVIRSAMKAVGPDLDTFMAWETSKV